MQEITLETDRKTQLVDITKQVQAAVADANGARAALVYVPHTTAGVTINEHADPLVAQDLENAPSHPRASLMGPHVLVPLRDGALALGTWQGIFLCEFDGPRTRSVYVTVLQ